MNPALDKAKAECVSAFRAWDELRGNPLAGRDEIEAARARFTEASKRHADIRRVVSVDSIHGEDWL